jgi:hypothetical protein
MGTLLLKVLFLADFSMRMIKHSSVAFSSHYTWILKVTKPRIFLYFYLLKHSVNSSNPLKSKLLTLTSTA